MFPYRPYRSNKLERRWIWLHGQNATVAPTTHHSDGAITPEMGSIDDQMNEAFAAIELFNADTEQNAASGEKAKIIVLEGLQLLFHCGYLVLVEYVECVVQSRIRAEFGVLPWWS
ncbi:unnamed protein product [Phytophthora lilii]|uniref:Unnamed protein product n=1 Tax=Phytophthora lilii TaxID=2077276 RepID=A0A9W6TR43_9STRA|nr:unnamed protein product [Phytophthora lilii]